MISETNIVPEAELPFTIADQISDGKNRNLVYKAIDKQDQSELVVKCYKDKHQSHYQQEKLILSSLDHPNIVKMVYFFDKATIGGCDYSLIVTQFSKNGTLFDFLISQYHKQDLLTLELALTIFAQLVEAVSYMHKKGFAHLDIKLENILVHDDYTIKLNDFDSSQKVSDTKLIGLGTPNARAPEIKGNYCADFKAADTFSLGVVLYMMITLQPLFLEKPQTKHQTLDYFWAHNESAWKKISKRNPQAIDDYFPKFINMLVAQVPKNRPSVEYMGDCPYIVKNTLSQQAYNETMEKRHGVPQKLSLFNSKTNKY